MLTIDTVMIVVGWLAFGALCAVFFLKALEEVVIKWETRSKPKTKRDVLVSAETNSSTYPEVIVKLIPACNGRILEVSSKKPHAHAAGHWDWEHEMFIIEEGQNLSEAIAMVMLMKGLEK